MDKPIELQRTTFETCSKSAEILEAFTPQKTGTYVTKDPKKPILEEHINYTFVFSSFIQTTNGTRFLFLN